MCGLEVEHLPSIAEAPDPIPTTEEGEKSIWFIENKTRDSTYKDRAKVGQG